MKNIFFVSLTFILTLFLNAQTRVDKTTNRIFNYHSRLKFNAVGYNDYDLGTSNFLQYSPSIIKIDVDEKNSGTMITYILGEKKYYYITKCILDWRTGAYEFELIDNDDLDGGVQKITTIGAAIIISNNTIIAFKIFIKGKNEAIILTNR